MLKKVENLLIKSPEEIESMRVAGRLTAKVLEAVSDVIRNASSTSDAVLAAANSLTEQSDMLSAEVAKFLGGFKAA